MKYLFLVTVVIITASRCSFLSTKQALKLNPLNSYTLFDQKKSPQDIESYLRTIEADNPESEVTKWWANYIRAGAWKTENPQYACQLFTELGKDRAFPLQKLAYLRSQEVCPINEETNILYDMSYFKDNDWLHDLHVNLAYTKASETSNHKEIASLALLKSKESRIPSQKIAYMQEAITAAQKLNDSSLVQKYKERLYKLAPRLKPKPSKSEMLSVAYDYRRARQFDKAIQTYKKVLNQKDYTYAQKTKAFHGIRQSYKLQHDKKRYIIATKQLASFVERYFRRHSKSKYYQREFLKTQIDLARALWTEGMISDTRAALDKTIKLLKSKQNLEEIYWLLARMEEEKGDFEKALSFADLALEESSQSKDILEKVLWQKAWNLRKLGFYKESLTYFERLVKETESPYAKNRYMYWHAISLKDFGRDEEAKEVLDDLIEADPFGYYGSLAYAAMGKEIPTILAQKKYEIKDQKLTAKKDTESVLLWLIAVRELEASQKLLANLAIYKMDFEEQVKYFRYFKLAEDYRGLFMKISALEPDVRNKLVAVDPEFFYPRPYLDLISQNAERFGISPELVLSIMRQESAFNPYARSHADAFGLMQVLPREARRMANQYKIPLNNEEDLFLPDVNIAIGSAYMKELWERYSGQFVISVSSYNASASAVRGWVKTRFQGDPYQFIEDIPYEETKEYVKLIFRNMVMYKRMNYSMQTIAFPDWCFATLQDYAIQNQLVAEEPSYEPRKSAFEQTVSQ